MKKLIMVFMFLVLVAGCAKQIQFVPPPLHSPPALRRFQPMAHPTTKEGGFWLNRGDADDLAAFFGHVWNVKEKWK